MVSVLFSINGWPAAELFAVLGTVITLGLYFVFQKWNPNFNRSNYSRHATVVLLSVAICLKSFGVSISGVLFLFSFIAFLVWFTWSVLEELPPSED